MLSFAVIVVMLGIVGVSVVGMVTDDVSASVVTTVDGVAEEIGGWDTVPVFSATTSTFVLVSVRVLAVDVEIPKEMVDVTEIVLIVPQMV